MQTRLFSRFEQQQNPGRPKESDRRITSSGDPRLGWVWDHAKRLNALPAEPLAFYFQTEVRSWLLWQWDSCVDEWEREPNRYPKFQQFPIFVQRGENVAAEDDWDERLPPEDFLNSNNRLSRGLRMIQEDPIVTITTLQKKDSHSG